MINPLNSSADSGLIHAETMSIMQLGSPVYSLSRFFSKTIAIVAQWEDESALELFLSTHPISIHIKTSWHLKLRLIHQWGSISGFRIAPLSELDSVGTPVVAITLARMRPAEISRFLRWGVPVERLVRDHPRKLIALASIRYPNLISTFSVWHSIDDLRAMVLGHSKMPLPKRHIDAMKETERKDFHFEFTTLRFSVLEEYGQWQQKQFFSDATPTEHTQ